MTITVNTPLQQTTLSAHQKGALRTGNLSTFGDLLITPLSDIARRCRISAADAKAIYDSLYQECEMTSLVNLNELEEPLDETFTTGDQILDQALGGGIRTGMLWEIFGESSAGKTQIALQLSLFVQNSREEGGLEGSTCYMTTSSRLPTRRLKEMSQVHPLLQSQSFETRLDNVHTMSIPTVDIMDNILTNVLPPFIQQKRDSPRPVKLIIIDALNELFHGAEKTNKAALFQRSKDLNRIGPQLHRIASDFQVAIVVLNEVTHRVERGTHNAPSLTSDDLIYSEQARFFNTCSSIPGEDSREAALGLVWANQVNARIMVTKTGRRRHLDEASVMRQNKSVKLVENATAQRTEESSDTEAVIVRRLSVIFNSVAPCISLDYIVTQGGVFALADDGVTERLRSLNYSFSSSGVQNTKPPQDFPTSTTLLPASVTEPALASTSIKATEKAAEQDNFLVLSSQADMDGDEDTEWDKYWEEEDDTTKDIDWDALEMSLSQMT